MDPEHHTQQASSSLSPLAPRARPNGSSGQRAVGHLYCRRLDGAALTLPDWWHTNPHSLSAGATFRLALPVTGRS